VRRQGAAWARAFSRAAARCASAGALPPLTRCDHSVAARGAGLHASAAARPVTRGAPTRAANHPSTPHADPGHTAINSHHVGNTADMTERVLAYCACRTRPHLVFGRGQRAILLQLMSVLRRLILASGTNSGFWYCPALFPSPFHCPAQTERSTVRHLHNGLHWALRRTEGRPAG